MRRRRFLAGLFAVPVAVACDPSRGVSPVPWPAGSAVSTVPPSSTVEVPDVGTMATLDEWHYVGDTGEPAWYSQVGVDAWANARSDFNLGFRIREAGVLDIQGVITAAGDPPISGRVFTLPTGYIPTNTSEHSTFGKTTGGNYVPVLVEVSSTTGRVTITSGSTDPYPVPGNSDALLSVWFDLQVFLNPPSAP